MITENCIIHNHNRPPLLRGEPAAGGPEGGALPGGEGLGCRNEILNGKTLFLADKAADYQRLGLTSVRLLFTTESPEECVGCWSATWAGGA